MGTLNFHKRNGKNGICRKKIIGRLRKSIGMKVGEKRRKIELAQKKIVNRFMRSWEEYGTSDSFVMPIMRYQLPACSPELKVRLDTQVRKKQRYLETEVNTTDMQIRIRPSIREI